MAMVERVEMRYVNVIVAGIIVVAVVGFVVGAALIGRASAPAARATPHSLDAVYSLPSGYTVEEFTPKADPSRQCILVGGGGLWCWAKDVRAP